MINPSKIKEGSLVYSIGSFNGKEMIYDFEEILIYLDVKGKLLFGNDFKICPKDHSVLKKLCHYIIRDKEYCQKNNINLDKGLLLTGPVGCGKTSIMRLLKYIVPLQKPFIIIPSRNIVFAFNHIGYKIIEDYGCRQYYCFDDMGVEPKGRHYGQNCNVIGEIIISRHELYRSYAIKTHGTTNLNAEELEKKYGERVQSRMRELFNLIAFDKHTKDKRK